jgi:hypothetical protein
VGHQRKSPSTPEEYRNGQELMGWMLVLRQKCVIVETAGDQRGKLKKRRMPYREWPDDASTF